MEQGHRPTPGQWLRLRLRALRAFSFSVSVLPVFVAVAFVRPPSLWKWDILIGSALGVLLLNGAGNLLNDYFDFVSGVDKPGETDVGRPGRLLPRGELQPGDVLAEALVCLSVGCLVGIYLLWRSGPGLLWFGAAAIFSLYAYTGPPFRFKHHALGEILLFLVCGPLVMTGAAYAQTGTWEWPVLGLSVPIGLVTAAVLLGNNLRDCEEDRAAGVTTATTVLGVPGARLLYAILVISPVLSVTVLSGMGILPYALLGSPLLLLMMRKPVSEALKGRFTPNIDQQTAQFQGLLLVLMFVTFVTEGVV